MECFYPLFVAEGCRLSLSDSIFLRLSQIILHFLQQGLNPFN